jgi:hypothetical protein
VFELYNFLFKKLSLTSEKDDFRIKDPGSEIQDQGSEIRDQGFEIWDQGSGKNILRITDPGVKEALKPGSITLVSTNISDTTGIFQ